MKNLMLMVEDVRTLRRFYDEGDDILQRYGNDGFGIIKMLESTCVSQWIRVGLQHRPELNLPNPLDIYLQETVSYHRVD